MKITSLLTALVIVGLVSLMGCSSNTLGPASGLINALTGSLG